MTLLAMEADIALPTWLVWIVASVLIAAILYGAIIAFRRSR